LKLSVRAVRLKLKRTAHASPHVGASTSMLTQHLHLMPGDAAMSAPDVRRGARAGQTATRTTSWPCSRSLAARSCRPPCTTCAVWPRRSPSRFRKTTSPCCSMQTPRSTRSCRRRPATAAAAPAPPPPPGRGGAAADGKRRLRIDQHLAELCTRCVRLHGALALPARCGMPATACAGRP
jgi:hypothetical protein